MHGTHHSKEVDVKLPVCVVELRVLHCAGYAHARIVNENINAIYILCNPIKRGVHALWIRHIGIDMYDVFAHFAASAKLVDLIAVIGKQPNECEPYAAASAGDHRNFAHSSSLNTLAMMSIASSRISSVCVAI